MMPKRDFDYTLYDPLGGFGDSVHVGVEDSRVVLERVRLSIPAARILVSVIEAAIAVAESAPPKDL
jgi:hypothetical protein